MIFLTLPAHPTVPKESMVANINLDQLRPLFPLRTLTMLALDDSTLGDTARAVAAPLGICIQPDPEPDRNLLRRSDHFNFMQIGVPPPVSCSASRKARGRKPFNANGTRSGSIVPPTI